MCPRELMPIMDWADVEHRACGSPEIPVEELKVSKCSTLRYVQTIRTLGPSRFL
jgi:hypothetical protein